MKYAKWIFVLVLIGFLYFIMHGDTPSDYPVDDIEKVMIENMNLSGVQKGDDQQLKRFYGLNSADYEGDFLYLSKSNMDVEEILVVKVKNSSQISAVEAAMETRIEVQLNNFNGYGVEQTAMLQNHELVIRGNYLFLGVSKQIDQWKKSFLNSIE